MVANVRLEAAVAYLEAASHHLRRASNVQMQLRVVLAVKSDGNNQGRSVLSRG
jgi:hypothetical protein